MDDLTRIDGIGKATARRLREENIISFAMLAALGEERAAELAVKPEWIASAKALMQEVSQGEEQEAASPAPEGLAEAEGEMSPGATDQGTGQAAGDTPAAEGSQGSEYDGKPPRPEDGEEPQQPEGAGLPADSGTGDPQNDQSEAAELAQAAGAAFAGSAPQSVTPAVRIRAAKKAGFRRAGRFHPGEWVDHPAGTLSAEDLAALEREPRLIVEKIEE